MTDRDLLELCAIAFDAIPQAAKSRRVMKKHLKMTPGAYAGNGSHLLAKAMADKVCLHLKARE